MQSCRYSVMKVFSSTHSYTCQFDSIPPEPWSPDLEGRLALVSLDM